jgi:hypothetical protein
MQLRTITFAVSLALASACGVQNRSDREGDASDAEASDAEATAAEGLDATAAAPKPGSKVIARSDAFVKARSLRADIVDFKAAIDAILALEPGRTFMSASGQSAASAIATVEAFQGQFRADVNDFTLSNQMPNVRAALNNFVKGYDAAVKKINSTSSKTTVLCPTKKNPKKTCTKTAKLNTIPVYKTYVAKGGNVKRSAQTFNSYTLGGNAAFDRASAKAALDSLKAGFIDFHTFVHSDASQAGCLSYNRNVGCPSWEDLSDQGFQTVQDDGSITDFMAKFGDGLNGDPVVASAWRSLHSPGDNGDVDQIVSRYGQYKQIILNDKNARTHAPFPGFLQRGDLLMGYIKTLDDLMKLAK